MLPYQMIEFINANSDLYVCDLHTEEEIEVMYWQVWAMVIG